MFDYFRYSEGSQHYHLPPDALTGSFRCDGVKCTAELGEVVHLESGCVFIRILRSFKARLRSANFQTPAETTNLTLDVHGFIIESPSRR